MPEANFRVPEDVARTLKNSLQSTPDSQSMIASDEEPNPQPLPRNNEADLHPNRKKRKLDDGGARTIALDMRSIATNTAVRQVYEVYAFVVGRYHTKL